MSKRIKRTYWENEKPYSEIPYKNNQKHGIERIWYKSGNLWYETSYKNNQKHGVEKGWYESGELQYKHYYLYGNEVTKQEYLKHKMTLKLSCLKE